MVFMPFGFSKFPSRFAVLSLKGSDRLRIGKVAEKRFPGNTDHGALENLLSGLHRYYACIKCCCRIEVVLKPRMTKVREKLRRRAPRKGGPRGR